MKAFPFSSRALFVFCYAYRLSRINVKHNYCYLETLNYIRTLLLNCALTVCVPKCSSLEFKSSMDSSVESPDACQIGRGGDDKSYLSV